MKKSLLLSAFLLSTSVFARGLVQPGNSDLAQGIRLASKCSGHLGQLLSNDSFITQVLSYQPLQIAVVGAPKKTIYTIIAGKQVGFGPAGVEKTGSLVITKTVKATPEIPDRPFIESYECQLLDKNGDDVTFQKPSSQEDHQLLKEELKACLDKNDQLLEQLGEKELNLDKKEDMIIIPLGDVISK